MRLIALSLAACLPGLATAQPTGIAFVQAPEQSSGAATGTTPTEAFTTATAICTEGGALAEDCLPIAWCFPAGWSIEVFAQNTEGFHWRAPVCGLPSEAVARAVAEQLCDATLRPDLMDCALVAVTDPDGNTMTEPEPK
jgi:hypothetical protein